MAKPIGSPRTQHLAPDPTNVRLPPIMVTAAMSSLLSELAAERGVSLYRAIQISVEELVARYQESKTPPKVVPRHDVWRREKSKK